MWCTPVLDKEDEFLGVAPDTKGMEDSDPTDACSVESWLRRHGSDRNRAMSHAPMGALCILHNLSMSISTAMLNMCQPIGCGARHKPPGLANPHECKQCCIV